MGDFFKGLTKAFRGATKVEPPAIDPPGVAPGSITIPDVSGLTAALASKSKTYLNGVPQSGVYFIAATMGVSGQVTIDLTAATPPLSSAQFVGGIAIGPSNNGSFAEVDNTLSAYIVEISTGSSTQAILQFTGIEA